MIIPIKYGFTLIEVMISVVILTVSLLGVAGMYGFAAKFAHDAKQQAHAVYMANDILEGLRMDKNSLFMSVLARNGSQYQLRLESSGNSSRYSEHPIDHTSNHVCLNNNYLCVEIANWQQHLDTAFSAVPASVCLALQRQNATAIVHAKVTINWLMKNATPSSVIPMLDATCGDIGIGRRQLVVQTLL